MGCTGCTDEIHRGHLSGLAATVDRWHHPRRIAHAQCHCSPCRSASHLLSSPKHVACHACPKHWLRQNAHRRVLRFQTKSRSPQGWAKGPDNPQEVDSPEGWTLAKSWAANCLSEGKNIVFYCFSQVTFVEIQKKEWKTHKSKWSNWLHACILMYFRNGPINELYII